MRDRPPKSIGGSPNIAPPSRSRLPVTTLSASSRNGDQGAVAPEAGAGAPVDGRAARPAARSRAERGGPRAATPGPGLGRLGGVLGDELAQPVDAERLAFAIASSSSSPSSKITWSSESSSQASVSGWIARCSKAPRGLRAPRIDDDDPAAAGGDRVQLVLDPRSAHHAAVRDQRVGADDQQQVGAREVGDRHLEGRAVEEVAGREAVADVLRRGGVEVRRAERVEEALDPERMRVGEGARVAHVPADRVAAVAVADPAEPGGDLVSASSQVTRSNSAGRASAAADAGRGRGRSGPRSSRSPSGRRTRAESGWSGSGRSFVSRPSSTVATIPHSGSQIRQ